MIVYFASKKLSIFGQASTSLPNGLKIISDKKIDEIETGISTFEFEVAYDEKTRLQVEEWVKVGNYVLVNNKDECSIFTIIETETDTKDQTVYAYAEDIGLELINITVGEFESKDKHKLSWYIQQFIVGSGFEIGKNSSSVSKALSFDNEQTVAARLADLAAIFNCEISYSFKISNMRVERRYVNIHKPRGRDEGKTLYLNKHIDKIVVNTSVAKLATALKCKGGTPDDADDPITLKGFSYDDGDIYVHGDTIYSREAYKKWARYIWMTDDMAATNDHITRLFEDRTTSQQELFNKAYKELTTYKDAEVNYEVEIKVMPDDVLIGDRVNIIDEKGELYLSSRILKLERSECENTVQATLGDHIIKPSGIHQKVLELAEKFQTTAASAARAKAIADAANQIAENAQFEAKSATIIANGAQAAADAAQAAADTATQSAADATAAADEATTAVSGIQGDIEAMNQDIAAANEAAEYAKEAAETAKAKAEESLTASEAAKIDAAAAQTAASEAKAASESAESTSNEAKTTAETAVNQAEEASTIANAAKLDSEAAKTDVKAVSDRLDSVSTTMQADYARKTELTETEANLQSQITQNAAQISQNVQSITKIDETANDAAEWAEKAQETAEAAQADADDAATAAAAAQTAADNAAQAAANAQAEADTAAAAAATAQEVADKAETDLATAQANLAAISGRVDATEEDIAAAEQLVIDAQAAADKAKADAATATSKAESAQSKADRAATAAANAQASADDAVNKATIAQATADAAKGDASAAQATADEAKNTALNAKTAADAAAADAAQAQTTADNAVADAAAATQAAAAAQAEVDQAEADLAAAKEELATIESKADATAEEVEAAKAKVAIAQAAADEAKTNAANAQATANAAQANAEQAQKDADTAQQAADDAQAAADAAQAAADAAQAEVDALEVRVIAAETSITQTSQQIELLATKQEVATTLGGYYTKDETEGRISTKADEINLSVTQQIENIQIGGRNYATVSMVSNRNLSNYSYNNYVWSGTHTSSLDGLKIDFSSLDTGNYVISYKVSITDGELVKIGGHVGTSNTVKEWYVNGELMETKYTANNTTAWSVTEADVYEIVIYLTINHPEPFYIQPNRGVGTSVTISVTNIMVEKGNKKSDWKPAPEDVDGKFDNYYTKAETDTSIQLLNDSISLCVTETELGTTLGGYYTKEDTEARLTATSQSINLSVDSKIENIKVGGRNLFAGYGEEEIQLNDYQNVGSFKQFSGNLTFDPCETVDDVYTISFWAKSPNGSTPLSIYNQNSRPRHFYFPSTTMTKALGSEWEYFTYTFVNTDGGEEYEDTYCNRIEFYASAQMGVLVKKIKVEKGTLATDWTPAPEDVDSEIDDATSKADNALEGLTEAQAQLQLLTDSIAQLVRNGETGTLIKQTSDGLYYFDISELESTIDAANTAIADLEGVVNKTKDNVDILNFTAETLQSKVEYVKSYTDENDQPCLELGEGDSVYKLFVTNTGILMMDGSDTPTKLTNKQLDITRAVVRTEMQIGDDLTPNTAGKAGVWTIKRRNNGNIGLVWKDVDE